MNRYYLKAGGSVCYDDSGITYPVSFNIDLETLLKLSGASEIKWMNQFGWDNQPEVLCFGFFVTDEEHARMSMLADIVNHMGLYIRDHWDYENKNLPW